MDWTSLWNHLPAFLGGGVISGVATYLLRMRKVAIEEERQDLDVLREGRDTYRQTTRDLRKRVSELETALSREREQRIEAEIERMRHELQARHLWARIDRLADIARAAEVTVPDPLVDPWPSASDVSTQDHSGGGEDVDCTSESRRQAWDAKRGRST